MWYSWKSRLRYVTHIQTNQVDAVITVDDDERMLINHRYKSVNFAKWMLRNITNMRRQLNVRVFYVFYRCLLLLMSWSQLISNETFSYVSSLVIHLCAIRCSTADLPVVWGVQNYIERINSLEKENFVLRWLLTQQNNDEKRMQYDSQVKKFRPSDSTECPPANLTRPRSSALQRFSFRLHREPIWVASSRSAYWSSPTRFHFISMGICICRLNLCYENVISHWDSMARPTAHYTYTQCIEMMRKCYFCFFFVLFFSQLRLRCAV